MSAELIDEVERIKTFVSTNLKGAYLKYDFIINILFCQFSLIFANYILCGRDEHLTMLTYYVPPAKDFKWSSMFGLMETARHTLAIDDYSISQTSLEQVFLSFTKHLPNDESIKSK